MKRKRLALKGKRIVITRSASGSGAWQNYFKQLGAKIYYFPTIEIVPIKSRRKIDEALAHISDFDWVIATSREGLRAISIAPDRVRALATLGGETEKMARGMGYRNIFRPRAANVAALARELALPKHASILLLRSTIASRALPNMLAARGARVVDIPAYRTLPLKNPDHRFSRMLERDTIDYLTFASPSAIRGFLKRVDKKLHKKALGVPAVAIGPRVAGALKRARFRDIRVAHEPTAKGMAEVMI